MKHLALLALAALAAAAQAAPPAILFVGNSYTFGRIDPVLSYNNANVDDMTRPRPDLPDPNFTRTVVLIVELNTEGTVGLILNRRSDVTLASVFEKMKPHEGSSPVFYVGGPVQIEGVIGLLRADTGSKDTHHVFGDVYVTSGREPLENMVAAGADPSRFRAYLGYAGWSPGQLERETAQGSWRGSRT